jgi:hypothetical protein
MVGFLEDLVGDLGPDGGVAAVVPAVAECTDLDHQLADEAKVARWMTRRSMIPNQISTTLSHDLRWG